ncbi:hypothetical protein CFP65_5471 [Kitasatospora sp. MMS16-BH015]|uniref:LAETG motif-containing sortase-dependent surface protein n=1 Tax=Kitasatospora sp. MMS16-BH015 TaxID=2018025 RepID=UPI000CA1EC41|nr:LAETG motif-containing sortase-dependent surface protein [Kitasatospora sp. MMS16-BH015]AUG80172.1 hypothetical protein CFP65_5471 [Kitasatospora sp. MMS16-BH015]
MKVRRGIAVVLVGAAAPLALAGSAVAHVPTWSVTCTKVSVSLANYSKDAQNSVTLIVGGEKLLDRKTFGDAFTQDFTVKAHSADLKAELIVLTSEDPKGEKGWSVDQTKTIPVCESPSPSPKPSSPSPKPSTPPPSTPASTKPPVTHTPTHTPTPTPTGPQLASTGGGGETPLIAGAGAAVVAAGGALLFFGRRRSSRRH